MAKKVDTRRTAPQASSPEETGEFIPGTETGRLMTRVRDLETSGKSAVSGGAKAPRPSASGRLGMTPLPSDSGFLFSGLASSDAPAPSMSEKDLMAEQKALFMHERAEEFRLDFMQSNIETVMEWDGAGYRAWKEEHAELLAWLAERKAKESRRKPAKDETEEWARQRYEQEHPCPNRELFSQLNQLGLMMGADHTKWPGYEEARDAWAEASASLWKSFDGGDSLENAKAAVDAAMESRDTWVERRGAEATRRSRAFAAAVSSAGVVEHDGASYPLVKAARLADMLSRAQVRPSESVLVEEVGDGRVVVAQPWSSLLVRADRDIAVDLGGDRVLYVRAGDWVDVTDPSDMGLVTAAEYETDYRRTDTRVGKREFGQ